jgi:predicted permease
MKRGWFWRRHGRGAPGAEVSRELEFHLEMRAREYEARGLSPESARVAAMESFGDVEAIGERLTSERRRRSRMARARESWSGAADDVRRAVRLLRRSPGYSAAIVLALAVGLAVITAWSALATAYLWRPFPFPAADRLVQIWGTGGPDWMDPPELFEHVVSWDLDVLSIVGGGPPQSVRTSWITPDWFEVSGARPRLGRLFGGEEAGPGAAAVAVIGHGLWQTRWGGDPGVIGRTFTAYSSDRPEESEVFTIIGVLEPGFWFVNDFTEVLVPLRAGRGAYMATLREGVTVSEADAAVRAQAVEADPDADVRVRDAREAYVERVRPVIRAVGGAVAMVLAIALGNALSIVVVRTLGREREFAVRAAIGAGRGRIARQLLAEGMLLSALSALAGLALAWLTLSVARGALPSMLGLGVPGGVEALRIGGTGLGVAVGACVLTGIVLALAPLLNVWRPALFASLRDGSRGTATRGRQRTRSALVAAELALSLALTVGAGLLVRSALHLHDRPLGFRPDGVAALSITLRQTEYPAAADRAALFDRIEAAIESAVPGIAVSTVGWAPMARSWAFPVETPERQAVGDQAATAFATVAGTDYFETLGIPFLEGRSFGAEDRAGAEPVAIVSASLASRLWPGGGPIGQRIRVAPDEDAPMGGQRDPVWRTVVGVVPDVVKTLTEENPPDLYYPVAQAPPRFVEVVVRDPAGRVRLGPVRDAIWSVAPDIPLDDVRWLEEAVTTATLPSRFLAWLVSAFGGFALALAGIGVWGVVAYTVRQGRRDVAIRMALGATGARVARAFVMRQAVWIGGGLLIGLAGARALSGLLRSQLYGVEAGDPATWLAAVLTVATVGLAASWLPARSAAATDPGRLLKGD